ncbi:MAG: holo-ACP synthase [Crenarchaeota archaeon]|nr:holo-ACP synthase [Thermoproteota archaeon]
MIIGVGIDVVSISRIKRAIEKCGERFLKRVFTERELKYCFQSGYLYERLAARFAAKEAVFKAIGPASRSRLGWRGVEIEAVDSEMRVVMSEPLLSLLREKGARNILISLSHDRTSDVAMAVAVLFA